MIGIAGHPETVGTMRPIARREVAAGGKRPRRRGLAALRDPSKLAFITQTTLSVDDTAEIVGALQIHASLPIVASALKKTSATRTTNRQRLQSHGPQADAMLVVGAPNSSNSKRAGRGLARKAGCNYAAAVQRARTLNWRALEGIRLIGITAGASGGRGG